MPFKLSYQSVILDDEDLLILQSGAWFNDKLLSFIGEYLMEKFPDKLHVFTPPETEIIRHSSGDEEVEMFFGMLPVKEKEMVAFLMNNNSDPTQFNGGSHWSLLVFDRISDSFRHFDSITGQNHRTAQKLADKAANLVGQKEKQKRIGVERVYQQQNASDCGLVAAHFLEVLAETNDLSEIGKISEINSRTYWRDIIVSLSEQ